VVAAYGALDGPCHATLSNKSSAPSWNFTLEDKFSDKSMIYFTTRGGYQAGGFNNANPAPFLTFEPEKVVDFEAGLKSDWSIAGRPLRTNIDGFYGHYSNMQRVINYQLTSGPLAGNTPIGVFNAGSSTYYGSDVEVSFFPIDSLEVNVAWTHIKATYDQFQVPAIPGAALPNNAALDLSGSAIAQTPDNTITAALNFHWPLPSGIGEVSSNLSYYYRSETRFHDVKPAGFETFDTSESYGIADFTTSWKGIFGSKFDAGVWVKNIADKEYAIYKDVQSGFGYETATYGDPRTFGANVRFNF
jgi:iron complex outermembrane receptor protein